MMGVLEYQLNKLLHESNGILGLVLDEGGNHQLAIDSGSRTAPLASMSQSLDMWQNVGVDCTSNHNVLHGKGLVEDIGDTHCRFSLMV
jgi:hypothetical protein